MVIIAEHNRTWKSPDYSPACLWPEDCYVQWGKRGLVLGREGSYTTAFFEAFAKPGGFIRGEGETIESAERAAFAIYQKEIACPGHVYSRGRYTNGGGHCQKCGRWESKAFKPIVILGGWRAPVDRFYFLDESDLVEPPPGHWRRKLWLRRKLFGEIKRGEDPEGGQ